MKKLTLYVIASLSLLGMLKACTDIVDEVETRTTSNGYAQFNLNVFPEHFLWARIAEVKIGPHWHSVDGGWLVIDSQAETKGYKQFADFVCDKHCCKLEHWDPENGEVETDLDFSYNLTGEVNWVWWEQCVHHYPQEVYIDSVIIDYQLSSTGAYSLQIPYSENEGGCSYFSPSYIADCSE